MTKKTQRRVLGENFQGEWAAVIKAPFGKLGIETGIVEGSLMVTQLCYLPKDTPVKTASNELAKEVAKQCASYFKDPHFIFDLPLKPAGTTFQNKVWERISKIESGTTTTYGELAKGIRSAPRAVGQACGSNPYPLIVPCHRVTSATGIGGFAHQDGHGYHRDVKTWLLMHEGVKF